MRRALLRTVTILVVLTASSVHGRRLPPKQLAVQRSVPEASPTVGEIYPYGQTLSPLTPAVARRIRAIASRNDDLHDDRFAKVGASATVNRNYLRCLAGSHVRLGEHGSLRAALSHFNGASMNPFRRQSLSATVGWHAGRAVWGNPPPLAQEVRASDPRFAVVMYGTNDLELNRPELYGRLLLRLTNMLIVRGVVPLMSTIMPRDDDPQADRYVTLYNAIVRSVAQLQQIPMIDYHRELVPLPRHGLASDGVHPNVYFEDGNPRGCDFTERGLQHGYNVRNLLTLTALDRAWRTLEGSLRPDRPAPKPEGHGSFHDPIVVGSLPFATAGDTSRSIHSERDSYPACSDADEGGPEVVYQIHLDEPARIYALATSTHGTDVDLHVLRADRGRRCVERSDDGLEVELEAGDHLISVDTFRRGDEPQSGRYTLAVARVDLPSDRTDH